MTPTQKVRGQATVVVGGAYGSEGKGAITSHISRTHRFAAAVRGGSSNAGHTLEFNGEWFKNQCLPVSWTERHMSLYIAAGAIVDIPQIEKEVGWMKEQGLYVRGRLLIDPNAGVITPNHVDQERERNLGGAIGSTVHGCGAALADKIWRRGFKTASEYPELESYISNFRISEMLHQDMKHGHNVLLEGTQGTLLSLNHAPTYPFCTSRDATTSGIITEAGIPPRSVGRVMMVIRSLPIRVGGNSGPTGGEELTWEEVARRSGLTDLVPERTTVTKKVRRIFEFDFKEFAYSCMLNGPTELALTFADYIDGSMSGATTKAELSRPVLDFVEKLERISDVPVRYVKTGPRDAHLIDMQQEVNVAAEVRVPT